MQLRASLINLRDRVKVIYRRHDGYDLDSFGLYFQGLKDAAKALDVDLEDIIEQLEVE